MNRARKPVVGIVCDVRKEGEQVQHGVFDKYVRAITVAAGAVPLLLPATIRDEEVDDLLAVLDGVFLPGSPSNVSPRWYAPDEPQVGPADPDRDALAIALVRRASRRRLPMFGVCRGFQEINVALGGTLHPVLHDAGGRWDHRQDESLPIERQYQNAHEVVLQPGGLLEQLAGGRSWHVNSLHGQGVDRIGDGLRVEAVAGDGTVEAFRLADPDAFCIGTQWHPEWGFEDDRLSASLFATFGEAVTVQSLRRV